MGVHIWSISSFKARTNIAVKYGRYSKMASFINIFSLIVLISTNQGNCVCLCLCYAVPLTLMDYCFSNGTARFAPYTWNLQDYLRKIKWEIGFNLWSRRSHSLASAKILSSNSIISSVMIWFLKMIIVLFRMHSVTMREQLAEWKLMISKTRTSTKRIILDIVIKPFWLSILFGWIRATTCAATRRKALSSK